MTDRTNTIDQLKDVLSDHEDYEEIDLDTYMSLWDGGQSFLDLHREQDSCRVFVDPIDEDEFVMDVSPCEMVPDSHYRIMSEDIEGSLEALEQVGFEHFTPEPPTGAEPFQKVFDTIEQAGGNDDDPRR